MPLKKCPAFGSWKSGSPNFESYDPSNEAFGVIYQFFNESSYKKIMATVHRKARD